MSALVGVGGCSVIPRPLDDVALRDFADDKHQRVVADQEPLSGSVDLYEAIARALKYNLDKRVQIMDVALRDQQLHVAHYSKLPQIVANAGYADRNNYAGGSSVSLLGPRAIGPESLQSSTSSERDVRTADLQFSWHILDFGLSWIRAKQVSDRVLVSKENRRRVVGRIVEDVRKAYWRAVTATRLIGRLQRLQGRTTRALRNNRRLLNDGSTSPLTALTYERELVEIQRELRNLAGQLATAKAQLAALMNVDPGQKYRIVVPRRLAQPLRVAMNPREMVSVALVNRSELREAAYNKRINEREAEAAILEMLPGVSFSAAPNWNSNTYLFNDHWVSWGAKAGWNLMKVFSYPDRQAEVLAKDDLLDAKALAVTMAIMTQVHVGRTRLYHARRKFRTAQRFASVQRRITVQIRKALATGKVSEQTAIREEMNAVVAAVKLDLAYVELQSAFANLYRSMGIGPDDGLTVTDLSVAELKAAVRSGWRRMGDRN